MNAIIALGGSRRIDSLLVSCVYFLLTVTTTTATYAHGLTHDRLHRLDHLIAQYPKDPVWYVKRGRVYHDSEQWNEALINYAKALQIDPSYYEALYWQGNALLQKGDYLQAKKILQEYLIQESYSPAGNRAIAKVYSQLGEHLKAADHYDRSISNDKNLPPQVYLERARILFKVDPIPVERINSGLANAIERHGAIITFLELLIDLNTRTKNYQVAIAWIEKLPANLKNSPHWLIKKAEIEALQGHRDNALKLYRVTLDSLATLPKYKQILPAFIAAHQKAEQGIRQLKQETYIK